MNAKEKYRALYEAYQHYQKTGDTHYDLKLYNSHYLSDILHTFQELKDKAYIANVSEKLLIDKYPYTTDPFGISPMEPLSFDITPEGIEFISSQES